MKFEDENFIHKHDEPYMVAMANCGEPNTNGSQFYITMAKCGWLDDVDVVFGRVVKGHETLKALEKYGYAFKSFIEDKIVIENCGECAKEEEITLESFKTDLKDEAPKDPQKSVSEDDEIDQQND